MAYTKKDLIRMRDRLIELEVMESRFNRFLALLRLSALGTGAGAAVSLVKYLDKSLSLEKAATVGVSCLAATTILGLGANFINKEAIAIVDEYLEYSAECPQEVLDAVDKHFKR